MGLKHIRLFGFDIEVEAVEPDQHGELPTTSKPSETLCVRHDVEPPLLASRPSYDHESFTQPMSMNQEEQNPSLQKFSHSMAIVVSDISFQDPKPETVQSSRGASSKKRAMSKRSEGSDSNVPRKKRRPRPAIAINAVPLNAVPLVPSEELDMKIRSLGGTEINMVIRKHLTASDCDQQEGRLAMPCLKSYLLLTRTEKELLNSRNAYGKPNKIMVEVIDLSIRTWSLDLKKWEYDKSSSYVLCCGWNGLAKANELMKGGVLEVWSFRVHGRLTLAVSR